MTRFSLFTDKELDEMDSAFRSEGYKYLLKEVRAERGLREKAEIVEYIKNDLHDDLVKSIANSVYGTARSCSDDEKLVVLCMINKHIAKIQDALTKISDKI